MYYICIQKVTINLLVMADKIFTNLANATKFASENGISPERVETAMSQCVPLAQEWNIEGVCEVTPIIVFREFFQQNYAGEWESFYDFSCAKYGLKDVANGNLYHLHRKDGKVSLYDENRGLEIRLTDFYRANTPKDLMMEKTPNQIGTPTAKKIRAWFDYWDEYYKLYNTRLAECKESAQKAFEDIKGKCDKIERIKMDNYLGVPSKFIACKSPLIAGMSLNYGNGKYSKSVEVDWTKQAEFLGF